MSRLSMRLLGVLVVALYQPFIHGVSLQDGPQEANDCGPFSCYILERLLGMDPDLDRIRSGARVDPLKGTSIARLRAVLEADGLTVEAPRYVGDASAAMEFPTPAIAHLAKKHYVVVFLVDDERVGYVDPPRVNLIPRAVFLSMWDGIIVTASFPPTVAIPQYLKSVPVFQSASGTLPHATGSGSRIIVPDTRARPTPESLKAEIVIVAVGGADHDFGLVEAESLLRHEFILKSSADEPLYLERWSSSCSCVDVIFSGTELIPGGEIRVVCGQSAGARLGRITSAVYLRFSPRRGA